MTQKTSLDDIRKAWFSGEGTNLKRNQAPKGCEEKGLLTCVSEEYLTVIDGILTDFFENPKMSCNDIIFLGMLSAHYSHGRKNKSKLLHALEARKAQVGISELAYLKRRNLLLYLINSYSELGNRAFKYAEFLEAGEQSPEERDKLYRLSNGAHCYSAVLYMSEPHNYMNSYIPNAVHRLNRAKASLSRILNNWDKGQLLSDMCLVRNEIRGFFKLRQRYISTLGDLFNQRISTFQSTEQTDVGKGIGKCFSEIKKLQKNERG